MSTQTLVYELVKPAYNETADIAVLNNNMDKIEAALLGIQQHMTQTMFDQIYPVGAIYISTSSTNPATLFGGTWEQLEDCFLYAGGTIHAAGETGGEAAHAITAEELPSHRHMAVQVPRSDNQLYHFATMVYQENVCGKVEIPPVTTSGNNRAGFGTAVATVDINKWNFLNLNPYTQYTGGSQAMSLMPPYLAVYVWKRTGLSSEESQSENNSEVEGV